MHNPPIPCSLHPCHLGATLTPLILTMTPKVQMIQSFSLRILFSSRSSSTATHFMTSTSISHLSFYLLTTPYASLHESLIDSSPAPSLQQTNSLHHTYSLFPNNYVSSTLLRNKYQVTIDSANKIRSSGLPIAKGMLINMCISVSVYGSLFACGSMFLCMCVRVSGWLSGRVGVCVCVYVCMSMSVWLSIWKGVCMCVWYVCVSECERVCLRVCVSVRGVICLTGLSPSQRIIGADRFLQMRTRAHA